MKTAKMKGPLLMLKSILVWQANSVRLKVMMQVHTTAMVINCASNETVTQPRNPDMARVKRIRRMILMGCFLRTSWMSNTLPRTKAMAKHDHMAI